MPAQDHEQEQPATSQASLMLQRPPTAAALICVASALVAKKGLQLAKKIPWQLARYNHPPSYYVLAAPCFAADQWSIIPSATSPSSSSDRATLASLGSTCW